MLSKVALSTIFLVFGMIRPGNEIRSPEPLAKSTSAIFLLLFHATRVSDFSVVIQTQNVELHSAKIRTLPDENLNVRNSCRIGIRNNTKSKILLPTAFKHRFKV